jgi:hypothetical protein
MVNFTNPLSHDVLLDMYSDVNHPEQKIKYMKRKGELVSIMKGWYLLNKNTESYSKFHVANLLYGPSYVSGLSALSHLGWIAEKSVSVQSMVFKRGKVLDTSIGRFTYSHLPKEIFSYGIMRYEADVNTVYLIANPTKALYDHILLTPNLIFTGKEDLMTYLENDLRFDTERLKELDKKLLQKLYLYGQKGRQIKILIGLLNTEL